VAISTSGRPYDDHAAEVSVLHNENILVDVVRTPPPPSSLCSAGGNPLLLPCVVHSKSLGDASVERRVVSCWAFHSATAGADVLWV
jgi:hypothetical protein